MKRQPSKKFSLRKAAPLFWGLFLVPLACGAVFALTPDWSLFVERAALASAMVNMPEGSIALLEQRFAGDISSTAPPPASAGQPSSSTSAASSQPVASSSQPAEADEPQNSTPNQSLKQPAPAKDAPEIPEEFRGTLVHENMAGLGDHLVKRGAGLIRNYTELDDDEVAQIASGENPIVLEDTDQPQVLIFHTHATESYEAYDSETYDTRNSWRDTDNTNNMVAVGNALAKTLEDAGIAVIHDVTQHDYPSYTGAYERSAETIQKYLDKYPSIKIALDVHRDAILRADDVTVKPVVEIDGKKAAQLMIITGSDDGTMNVPNWRKNLRFAASLQDQIEQDYPQLTRPIFFCYRKYNMDMTNGSILLEMGSNANTLEESIYTAELIGKSLVKLLKV